MSKVIPFKPRSYDGTGDKLSDALTLLSQARGILHCLTAAVESEWRTSEDHKEIQQATYAAINQLEQADALLVALTHELSQGEVS